MSEVQSILSVLKEAQALDADIYSSQQELLEFPEQQAALKQELEAEKQQMNALEEELKGAQLSQKEKEGSVGEKEAQIKKLDGQLNMVKTNKEYSAIQQEIGGLKADISTMEEDIIKAFDVVEEAKAKIEEEKKRLAACETQFKERGAEIASREKELQGSIEGLQNKRNDILGQLQPDMKDLYVQIVSKRQGKALAKINGTICGGCLLELRAQVINEVLLGENIVTCDSCSRILYSEKEAAEAS